MRYKNGHEIYCTLRSEYGYATYEIRSHYAEDEPHTLVDECNKVPVTRSEWMQAVATPPPPEIPKALQKIVPN